MAKKVKTCSIKKIEMIVELTNVDNIASVKHVCKYSMPTLLSYYVLTRD